MEGIGTEITHKIRSAIKAKLVDLGAYVDDELPDYIMVMVANKKSQAQMTEDLSLFLANNTEKFTAWLHGVLSKLQNATEGEVNSVFQQESDAVSRSTSAKAMTAVTSQKSSVPAVASVPTPAVSTQHLAADPAPVAAAPVAPVAQAPVLIPPPAVPPPEPIISIKPDDSDMMEELETEEHVHTPAVVVQSRPHAAAPVQYQTVTTSPPKHRPSAVARPAAKQSSVQYLPQSPVKPRLAAVSSRSSHHSREVSSQHVSQVHPVARKRKTPSSVVGSVILSTAPDYESEEEEPLRKGVASTVKVPERRPSLPPSKQANRSLLLRAISEANQSAGKARGRQEHAHTQEVMVQPMQYDPMVGSAASMEYHPTSYRPTVRVEGHQMGGYRNFRNVVSRTIQPSPVQEEDYQEHDLASPPGDRRNVVTKEQEDDDEGIGPDDGRSVAIAWHVAGRQTAATVSRVPVVSRVAMETRRVIQDRTPPKTVPISPIFTVTLDGEPSARQTLDLPKKRPASPKFIVTLDGVDPPPGRGSSGDEADDEAGEGSGPSEPEVPSKRMRVSPNMAPPRVQRILPGGSHGNVQQVTFTLDDSDAEEMDVSTGEAAALVEKKAERCHFWPACKNGDECPFMHPNTPCRNFPNCKFGEKCLFIHPNCKFDARCSRKDCPFTHASKRQISPAAAALPYYPSPAQPTFTFPSPVAPPAPSKQNKPVCRFFPNCTRTDCTFLHPKACHYGLSCTRPDCVFTHPSLPPPSAFKWSASRHISERKFADESKVTHIPTLSS
ncbi:zinc finger CCCH domain-containing protein 14-like isoform X3 [Branchiostoma lanceolatum]|uniref:zinc finger CCCH domain-containing protein 14-like isoform X3 n=1 Tax=Branchiostoma lanceolatum TaxID=7740 RepID=UPI003454744C